MARAAGKVFVSPASLLEVQVLVELGRVRLREGASVAGLAEDERWVLDEPPSASWFDHALELDWTRDPFDRLIAAHSLLRRWRLATGDAALLERLGGPRTLAL